MDGTCLACCSWSGTMSRCQFSFMYSALWTLFLFSKILLFVPLCQFDNLPAYFFQFTGFFGKFVEKRKRFLFSINGINDLYTLVIVIPDTAELLIESGELGIVFLRFLVNLHHLELSIEDTGEDKFGLVLHAGLFEHSEKLLVLTVIETKVVAVRTRVCQHLAPCGVTDSCFIFHNMKILKGSTWENLCLRKTFRARLSAGRNIFNR